MIPELVFTISGIPTCRQKGIQIQTVDAILAQLAIGHDLDFLTNDRDFDMIARHFPLRVLGGP